MLQQNCGKLINDFIERYGCKKKHICDKCGISYITLNKIIEGDESVKMECYISVLYFIGKTYTEAFQMTYGKKK